MENNEPLVTCDQNGFIRIQFQRGTVPEVGINGTTTEAVIELLLHRLRIFQSGPLSCRENALAITKLEEAIHWLQHRRARRQATGLEGTMFESGPAL